nr:hypothetical protein [Methanobacterium formicicum]
MGYLICGKCKSYYELQSGESVKDFARECKCGGKLRYVENMDIVDPGWKPTIIPRKSTRAEILRKKTKINFIPPPGFKVPSERILEPAPVPIPKCSELE